MKPVNDYPISYRSLRERWRDGDRWQNPATWVVLPLLLLVAVGWMREGRAAINGLCVIVGGVCVQLAMLRSSARMSWAEPVDREAAEAWLARNGYRQQGASWRPGWPRFLQLRSEQVRVSASGALGPKNVLRLIRSELIGRRRSRGG